MTILKNQLQNNFSSVYATWLNCSETTFSKMEAMKIVMLCLPEVKK